MMNTYDMKWGEIRITKTWFSFNEYFEQKHIDLKTTMQSEVKHIWPLVVSFKKLLEA